MDFGWPGAPLSPGAAGSDPLNLLSDNFLIDVDDRTLQCLMGGTSAAAFASCISGAGAPLGGEASGSGACGKREREEEVGGADDDEDSEEGGTAGGGKGKGRAGKKGRAAAAASGDPSSVKATREKARREKLNECFDELARLCDPSGKMLRTDRISIVQDAIRAMGALRVENNQLRQLNKFLEERARQMETARAQGMYQQHMMQQMAAQQMQAAQMQQQQQQQQQVAQVQQMQAQAQAGEQQEAQQVGGLVPAASTAGQCEIQPAASVSAAALEGAASAAAAVEAQQQAAAAQQAGQMVPPGMMLMPVAAAQSFYASVVKPDPMMGGGATMAMAPNGGYMLAPAGGMVPGGMGGMQQMMHAQGSGGVMQQAGGGVPTVMPANAPPVSWLPAPDISQDGKLRPPAA